jgi:hypothetical protein
MKDEKTILSDHWRDYAIVGIYVALSVIFTWPLLSVLTQATMGDGVDGWQGTWDLWWVNRALTTGVAPYHFSTLYVPYGATNYIHHLHVAQAFITLPVQWTLGVVAAYNVACLLALVLTSLAGYLLGRDITGERGAGFVAGLALGFAPHQITQLLGHLDVASIQFFVLGLWCLYRGLNTSTRSGLVWTLWSSVCIVAAALCHYYNLIYIVIVFPLFGLFTALRRSNMLSRRHVAAKTLIAIGLGLVVLSPLLVNMAGQLAGTDAPRKKEITAADVGYELRYYSADLLAYVTPSPFNPFWGIASAGIVDRFKGGFVEKVVFPGYAVIGLALVGVLSRKTRRKALFWLGLALLGVLLSFGPTLHILGTDTGQLMPAELIYRIPAMSIVRAPARFSVIALLGLALCAGLGVQAILKSRPFARARYRYIVPIAVTLVIGLEFFSAPYPTSRFAVERWFETAAVEPDAQHAVLEVPFDHGDPRPQQWQIASGLPLAGGYLARQPVYALSSGVPPFTDFGLNRYIDALPFVRSKSVVCKPAPPSSTYLDIMRLAGVRYLVLHLDRMALDDPRIQMAEELFPTQAIYRSDRLVVYDTQGGEAPPTLFGVVDDLYDWNIVEEGAFRWAPRPYARLHVWSGSEQQATVRLRLASFGMSREITISMAGKVLARETLDHTGRLFDLRWQAPKGFSTLLITASGPAISPETLGLGADSRPLTIRLSDCAYGTLSNK